MDARVRVTLGMGVEEKGVMQNKFYTLPLEMDAINSLTLSWTIVHPIDENSPLYGFGDDDFRRLEGELMVSVTAYDDLFSTTVAQRTSYTFEEIVYGAKFEMMYNENEDNTKTILHLDKIDRYTVAEMPSF
jgi:inward rectifier potassium channel